MTVRITAIAAGGDGVGRLPDGRAVFIPRTAPGDVVEPACVRSKRTFARAAPGVIVEPSPDRAEPVCPHYTRDDCGGCVLQHMTYAAQVRAKGRIVRDAIERIAKLDPGEVAVEPNPSPLGWRTRLVLSVDPRTGRGGLRRLGRPDETFALETCALAAPAVAHLWAALRAVRGAIPARTERLTLRVARDGSLHVIAHGAFAMGETWPRAADVAAALAAAGADATLWAETDGGAVVHVAGPAPSSSATVFEQVDPAMGDVVRRHAVASLGEVRGLRVHDLYAGLGETTALLAAAGADVESVEWDRAAVDEAERRGPSGPRRRAGRVEDVLPTLGDADAVVANPPRAGLGPAVTSILAARPPARIVHVSCDPATLARDLAALSGVHRIDSVRAFDSFPQTAHVETVAVTSRR